MVVRVTLSHSSESISRRPADNNGNQRRSIIIYYGSRSTPHTSYQEGVRRGVIPAHVSWHLPLSDDPMKDGRMFPQ